MRHASRNIRFCIPGRQIPSKGGVFRVSDAVNRKDVLFAFALFYLPSVVRAKSDGPLCLSCFKDKKSVAQTLFQSSIVA